MKYMYNAYEVCSLLGINTNREAVYIRCPWCNNKSKSLNINLKKGVYRCNKNPDHHGSITEFYANLRGFDNTQDAAEDIRKNLGKEGVSITYQAPPHQETDKEPEAADISIRNKAYKALFHKMPLEQVDKQNLLTRGFTEDEIRECGYKSLKKMSTSELFRLIEWLISQKLDLKNVPGFFTSPKKHVWLLNFYKPGIMMPSRNINNQIQCIQIRKRNEDINFEEAEGKCYYLTSRYKKNGASTSQAIHYAGEFETKEDGTQIFKNKNNMVVLIEGIMKADLFYHLTGQQAIAVPGVQCLKALERELPKLKEIGIQRVLIGYDMDSVMNINVLEALIKMDALIVKNGFDCSTLEWSVAMKRLNGTDYALNRDNDFVFSVKTYDLEIERKQLEQTLERILKASRKKIILALKNSKEATEENFKKLQYLTKVASKYDLIVDVMFWDLKLKGIDDYYVYKIRNVAP